MTFNISLSATDGAPPYHMAYATALITIVHASEVTPVFLQEVYTVNITENLPANTTVVQVSLWSSKETVLQMLRRKEYERNIKPLKD